MNEWQVEMLWRCASCAHDNQGRHTQCERCGKPKTGKEEYVMPADTSQAAAVTDPALLRLALGGANWRCKFCGSDQRRHDGACGHCGASQEQGQDLGALPSPQTSAVLTPRRRWPSGPVIAAVVAVLMLGVVLALVVSRPARPPEPMSTVVAAPPEPTFREVSARLVGVEWEQRVGVERYKLLPGEGFASARPADALEVKRAGQRVHHTDKVPDGTATETYTETVPDGTTTETYTERVPCGETCVDAPKACQKQCTSSKNGFANCKEVCTGGGRNCSTRYCPRTQTRQIPRTRTVTRTRQVPRFKDVPQYQDWYVWKSWGWAPERTVRESGTTPELRWPTDAQVALDQGVGKGEKERATRSGSYRLKFAGDDGGQYSVEVPEVEAFKRQAAASAFRLRVEGGRATLLEPPEPAASR